MYSEAESSVVVSFVVDRLGRSGGCRVLIRAAHALMYSGHAVTIVVPKGRLDDSFPIDDRIRVQEFGIRMNGAGALGSFLSTLSLCACIPDSDVVIFSYFVCAVPLRLQNLFGKNRKVVYFVQGNEPLAFGALAQRFRTARRLLAEWSLRSPYTYFCNSRYVQAFLRRDYGQVAELVHPGVDLEVFGYSSRQPASDHPVVAVMGTPTVAKGWGMLADTLGHLIELRPDVKVSVIARSPARGLERLGSAVEWRSPRGDGEVAEVLRSSDVFFSSSRIEGFGLSVLESMAVGTPVVATDSLGVRDLVKPGGNGELVEFGDSRSAAGAIARLLSDPELWLRYSEAGASTAREFSDAVFLDRFVTAVERIPIGGL